jgi:hypothetical protein
MDVTTPSKPLASHIFIGCKLGEFRAYCKGKKLKYQIKSVKNFYLNNDYTWILFYLISTILFVSIKLPFLKR